MSWAWLIKRCFPSQTNVSSGALDAIDSNIFAHLIAQKRCNRSLSKINQYFDHETAFGGVLFV
jgi:hypothetical protein